MKKYFTYDWRKIYMEKKKICLVISISICILFLSACNNYPMDVLELEEASDYDEDLKGQEHLLEGNFEKTKLEDLSDLKDISMEVVEDSITPTGFKIVFENSSNKNIVFEDNFIIETRVEEEWYELPMLTNDYDFNDAACKMPYNQSKEISANWERLYGVLETGEYRILKEVMDLDDFNTYNKEYLVAEFKID